MVAYKLKKEDLLSSGAHFGHETKRWNPQMDKFLLGNKEGIHIFDIDNTIEKLFEAYNFLAEASSRGQIIFVGTKRQGAKIIKEKAIEAGAHFVDKRWPGGLLTNFKMVKNSLNLLNKLEKEFREGVYDRTKFEVSLMKKNWSRLSRLYSGVKNLTEKPTAVVVLDTKFELSAVREAKKLRIPVVGLVDSNADPKIVDYVIPANDDAIKSISLIIDYLSKAVLDGNKGNGVNHDLRDYSSVEVVIKKTQGFSFSETTSQEPTSESTKKIAKVVKNDLNQKNKANKGILETIQEKKVKKIIN